MPDCEAIYLANYLFEVGPSAATGMGESPISHAEIAAWMANTGIRLTSWEARTLRRLSVDYVSEGQKATERGCAAPWQSEGVAIDKLIAANAQKNAFRDLAKL